MFWSCQSLRIVICFVFPTSILMSPLRARMMNDFEVSLDIIRLLCEYIYTGVRWNIQKNRRGILSFHLHGMMGLKILCRCICDENGCIKSSRLMI